MNKIIENNKFYSKIYNYYQINCRDLIDEIEQENIKFCIYCLKPLIIEYFHNYHKNINVSSLNRYILKNYSKYSYFRNWIINYNILETIIKFIK